MGEISQNLTSFDYFLEISVNWAFPLADSGWSHDSGVRFERFVNDAVILHVRNDTRKKSMFPD